MLGRLRMSLDECQKAYTILSENIFTKEHSRANPARLYKFLQADGKFQKGPLCVKSTRDHLAGVLTTNL